MSRTFDIQPPGWPVTKLLVLREPLSEVHLALLEMYPILKIGIPVVSTDAYKSALRGGYQGLVKELGPAPSLLLLKLQEAPCYDKLACPSFDKKVCVAGSKKLPLCYTAGLEEEDQRVLLTEWVHFWTHGGYIIRVTC